MQNETNKIGYIVPAHHLYSLKCALAEAITKYQSLEDFNPTDADILKLLIQLEHNTNIDNYKLVYME